MRARHLISATVIAGIMAACGQKETISTDLIHLNLQQAEKQEAPKLSSLLKDIRYVALETNENSVLKNVSYIVLTDKYIVCEDGYNAMSSTKQTVAFFVPLDCVKTGDLKDMHRLQNRYV